MVKLTLPWKTKSIDPQPEDPVVIVAQLNARLQPIDRGDYFEDPLDEILKSLGIGEVTGGGTQLTDEPDGIAHCDIDISVNDDSPETIERAIEALEQLGAPIGSLLKFTTGKNDIPFGKLEGMALFLNGTDLPDAVYDTFDIDAFIDGCNELLQGTGSFRSHWQGSRETALYFYGTDFESMKSATAEFIASHPGCALARVVQIA